MGKGREEEGGGGPVMREQEGEVDKEQFAVIMIKEIQRFSQRETLNSMGEVTRGLLVHAGRDGSWQGDDVQRSMFLTMKLLFLEFESLQEQDDSHEELEEDVARINERIAGLAKTLKTLTEHASRQVREGSAHLQNGDKSSGHGVGRSDKQPSRKRLEGPEGLEGNKAHGAVARERGRREKTEEPASEGREKGHGKRRSEPPRSQRRSDQINKFQQLKKAIENIRKISQQDAQLEISRAVRTLNLEQSDLVLVGGSSQTTPRDQCLQLAQALSTSSAILKSHRPATLLDEQERNPSP